MLHILPSGTHQLEEGRLLGRVVIPQAPVEELEPTMSQGAQAQNTMGWVCRVEELWVVARIRLEVMIGPYL